MPCKVISPTLTPTRDEYRMWQDIGYTGTFEQYSKEKKDTFKNRAFMIMCGSGVNDIELCANSDCNKPADYLCDYPVGKELTCDRKLCADCANIVGDDTHYCRDHYESWKDWLETSDIDIELLAKIKFIR